MTGVQTCALPISKSALKAAHVKGCNSIASPSISLGSNAWTPNLWSVGALFNITGCSLTISSNASKTAFVYFSTNFLACLIVDANPSLFNLAYKNGLNNSKAIFFGKPHSWSLRSGPTTITDLPE